MTKYSLESRLTIISDKFQYAEADLKRLGQVWNFLLENYKGHPLQNLDELLSNSKNMERLFENMGIKK